MASLTRQPRGPWRIPAVAGAVRTSFWVIALGLIALYVFFVVLGAFKPGEMVPVSVAVGVLCVLYLGHALLAGRHAGEHDPDMVRARERLGF